MPIVALGEHAGAMPQLADMVERHLFIVKAQEAEACLMLEGHPGEQSPSGALA